MIEHFLITRFSTIFNNRPVESREYSKLFNTDRLDKRFKFFKQFFLFSLNKQTLKNFKIIIIYDTNLPEKYKNLLFDLTKLEKNIILHKWNIKDNLEENNWLKKYYSNESEYIITTRMDDDDLVNSKINEKLYEYINKLNFKDNEDYEEIISFTGGKFIYENNNTYQISSSKYKCPGLFLSLINKKNKNKNIYNYSHDRIHLTKIKLTILKMNNCWSITNYNYNLDSTRNNRMKKLFKNKIKDINLNEFYKTFNLL